MKSLNLEISLKTLVEFDMQVLIYIGFSEVNIMLKLHIHGQNMHRAHIIFSYLVTKQISL